MTQDPAAAHTATGPMVIAALEQTHLEATRIIDDRLAKQFLPRSTQRIVDWCRWAPLRSMLVGFSEMTAPGAWGGMLGRKRYAEDALSAAIAAGVDAVVVLGAGFDTKALRLAVPAGVRSFEVDFPGNRGEPAAVAFRAKKKLIPASITSRIMPARSRKDGRKRNERLGGRLAG